MASAKKTQIVITANAAVAKKVMDELQQRIDGIKQKMAALDTTTSQGQKEFKKLEKELVSYNSAVAQNVTNTERIDKAIKNLAGTSLNELKRALSAAKSELGKMSANDKGLKQMQGNVKALQTQIDKLTGSVHKQGGAWQTAMKNLTAYVGLFTMFNKAKELVTDLVKKNLDYSSSLTDIRKVAGVSMDDVNELSRRLAQIDTRTSVEGLAKLAYEGAKLGMSKYGVEGMAGFVRAADQINVAIGEEMGEKALPALSKLVDVMGLIPKLGIEKAMLATGSAMFKLSSTSTATSGNIVEFAKRLTGVARTAGITTDQLLALGSASDSMYLMPEVASTAMSKFIVALQRNHNLIEKDLGIQQGTIKNMYAAGNAMDAIVLVLEKMKQTGNMNALGGIFKDLGSDGQRLVTAMVTMSKNVDMLKDHLVESKEAFTSATAVTDEYKMQQTSAMGILERANNLWEKAFVNPEGVENVKEMAQAWYDVSNMILTSPFLNGMLHTSFQVLIFSVKVLVALLPTLINLFVSAGFFNAVAMVGRLAKQIREACAAQTMLNVVSSKNIYIAIATVVMTAVSALWSFVNAQKEAAEAAAEAKRKAEAWKDSLGEARIETDKLVRKLALYKKTMENSNLSMSQRNEQISRFNKEFRQYINKLGIEINSVDSLRKHYKELTAEIQRATYYRLREKTKEEILPAYQKSRVAAAGQIRKALSQFQKEGSPYTVENIVEQMSNGKKADQLYREIIKERYPLGIHFTRGHSFEVLGTNGLYKKMPGFADLLSALRYYENSTAREANKEKEINDAYSPFVKDSYTPWVEDEVGTLEKDAVDKKAVAAAKAAKREAERKARQEKRDRIKSWRDDLKEKKSQANAIMDNVSNFYNRQINAQTSRAMMLDLDEVEQKQFVDPIKSRMNEALRQVRLAIAGKPNQWEDFKQTLRNDLIEETDDTGVNLSEGLLKDILSNDIDALHKKMEGLSGNLGIPLNSVLAEIFANATKNESENIKLEQEQKKARRKAAQDYDYIGAVQRNAYDAFNELGFLSPTPDDLSTKDTHELYRRSIINVFETARKYIATLYNIDPTTKDGQGLLLKFLFGDDPMSMGAYIEGVLGDDVEQWMLFYTKLIQYSDEYTEAEKKVYDQQKKISDQMWAVNKRNLANQAQQRKMQEGSNLFGKRTNYLSNLGLKDLTADPEVELMKARMQAAEDYYAFIEKNYRNKQLLQEADTARQEAELAYANQMATSMKNRLSQMKELVQPIESFGEAVGSALADMKNDAESANEAIKSALKSMIESWGKMAINSVNTQMWKAINDAGAKRGKANAQPGIDAARANANADSSLTNAATIGTAGNPAHVIVDNGASIGGNITSDAPVDTTNNTLGDATGGGSGTSATQDSEPPRAWQKRNAGGTMADYNAKVQAAAGQTGNAVADVATGNATLGEAGAGIAMSGMNAALNANLGGGSKNKKEDKERKKQLKEERKHQKDLTKEAKRGLKDREKETDKGIKNITDVTNEGNKEQSKGTQLANDAIVDGTQAALNTTLVAKQQNNSDTLKSDAARTQGEVTFSIAGAMAKCFEFLGPIAGPIAAAVVMSTLMGLLQWALSSALGSSSKSSSSSSSTNTKLKTGMLTYDSGNVQDLKPFVGDDGEMYWAEENNAPNSGVNLLSTPTATTINGQRSLVAENGPELVIGRETTKAMMMNNPSLLKALVNYDSNYSGRTAARRAFDKGNLSDLEMDSAMQSASQAGAQASATSTADATNSALLQAVSALITRLEQPITAQVNMFGRGQLYESLNKANQFMKGK